MNDETAHPNEDTPFPHQKLDAYRLSREMTELVFAAKIRNAELRDQAERSSTSCFLAINEGLPHIVEGRPEPERNHPRYGRSAPTGAGRGR